MKRNILFVILLLFSLYLATSAAGLGQLVLDLLSPGAGVGQVDVYQNSFFNVSLNVTCLSDNCGGVNVSLDPTEDASWNKNYTTPYSDDDIPYSIAVGPNNTVYVVGGGFALYSYESYTDWWIKKFWANGTEVLSGWNKNYTSVMGGGTGYREWATAVGVDSLGNIYVGGFGFRISMTPVSGDTNLDWWIKKFYPNGTEIRTGWNKNFTSSSLWGTLDDRISSLAIDSSDNVYVAGFGHDVANTTGYDSGADWWIKKFNSSGTEDARWNITYTTEGVTWNDYAYGIAVDSNKNAYVVGTGYSLVGGGPGGSGTDWLIKKYFPNGTEDLTWNKSYSGRANNSLSDEPYSVTVDSHDNIYVVGYGTQLASLTSSADLWIKKFWSNGTEDMSWNKNYTSPGGADSAYSVKTDFNDDVYVAGYGTYLSMNGSSYDWWIKKFHSNGTEYLDWNLNYSSNANPWNGQADKAYSVAVSPDGNVYVAGTGCNMTNDSATDWWIKKFDYSKGLVSTTPGALPFYVNESNPVNINLNQDQSRTVTFWLNATGNTGNYVFFAYANESANASISNSTRVWNVTILATTSTTTTTTTTTTTSTTTTLPVCTPQNPPSEGDWNITLANDCSNGNVNLSGKIFIRDGAVLTLRSVNLRVNNGILQFQEGLINMSNSILNLNW